MMSRDDQIKSYELSVRDKTVTFTHLGIDMIPSFYKVTSVAVIPFTKDGDLIVVNLRHRGLDLPGGHVEPNEKTPEETLRREAMEEACMTVRNPVLAEVIESDYFDDRVSYMLLYGAFVDELHNFTPNNEASERLIISPEAFIQQYSAGNKPLMDVVIKSAWQLLNNQLPL